MRGRGRGGNASSMQARSRDLTRNVEMELGIFVTFISHVYVTF